MSLFSRLKALFLPSRTLLPGTEAAFDVPAGHGGWRREFVAPRGTCLYHQQDFSGIPPRRRKAAARLAARRLEPSPGAPVYVCWLDAIAHFWFLVPVDGAIVPDPSVRWLPESVLLASDAGQPVRLLQLVDGFEGQVWHAGQLVASQWWQQQPGLEAWQRFLRATSRVEEMPAGLPVPVMQEWSDYAWGKRQRLSAAGVDLYEAMGWSGLVLVTGLLLGWQLTGLLRWHWANESIQARLDTARTESAPSLSLREQAEADLAEMDALRPLHVGVDDRAMMAAIIQALPEGSRFSSWQRDTGSVRVLVRHAETDPRVFVSAFSGLPELSAVAVTPQADGVMQLVFPLDTDKTMPAGPGGI